jgi:MT0933-like antitoxin protein
MSEDAGGLVSEFSNLEKKAESYAEEHPEQVDKGIGDAAQYAERETGHKYDTQIEHAEDAAEKHVGGQQAGQGQSQESQGDQG